VAILEDDAHPILRQTIFDCQMPEADIPALGACGLSEHEHTNTDTGNPAFYRSWCFHPFSSFPRYWTYGRAAKKPFYKKGTLLPLSYWYYGLSAICQSPFLIK
jgi:hypothetical protein